MIRSFFQNLERSRVSHLLVSGQAAVLHGAAMFSEDIDLWVEPSGGNLDRLLQVLRSHGARYHKLTPRVTGANAGAGHGFHFLLPGGGDGEVYLDVMGRPPRVAANLDGRSGAADIRWIWSHLFELSAAETFLELAAGRIRETRSLLSPVEGAWVDARLAGSADPDLDHALEQVMYARMDQFRQADRTYWRPVLDALRVWRSQGRLCPEGGPV